MSVIFQDDPHPGRCKNYRTGVHFNGAAVRCKELEGHEGRCRFPEPHPYWTNGANGIIPQTPIQWVPPIERSRVEMLVCPCNSSWSGLLPPPPCPHHSGSGRHPEVNYS